MIRCQDVLASFLASALSVGFAISAQAQQKVEGPKVHWNMSMWGAKRAINAGPEELARLLSEATNGNFTIQVHYNGVLSAPKENLDGINIGAFEMTMVATSYTPGRLPVMEGLGLPFLPTPTVHHTRIVREAYVAHPDQIRELARANARCLMPVLIPSNEFIGKGKPPETLADWKGLRVRALGGDAQAIKNVGAVPTNLPPPEMYGALERGMMDAASSAYYALASFKLHEVSKWYTTNMALSVSSSAVLSTIKAYEGLPPQYKTLIADLMPRSMDAWEKAHEEDSIAALAAFQSQNLVPVSYPAAELAKLQTAAKPLWAEWVEDVTKKGYRGQELLHLILDTATKVGS